MSPLLAALVQYMSELDSSQTVQGDVRNGIPGGRNNRGFDLE